jgi:hypothetical protein
MRKRFANIKSPANSVKTAAAARKRSRRKAADKEQPKLVDLAEAFRAVSY